MHKRCPRCKKLTADFGKNASQADGLQTHCRSCKKVLNAEYYRENKEKCRLLHRNNESRLREELRAIKADRGCSGKDCKEHDPDCLEFHHVSYKTGNVATFVSKGMRIKALKEIENCAVFCSNCHRKLHSKIKKDQA